MNIIIFGAGKVGQYLTRIFSIEDHNITVIEADSKKCNKMSSLYDISIINSEGIKKDVFNADFFSKCELFIAVSPADELNIIACSIAKKLGVNRIIARIRNNDYDLMDDVIDLKFLGIDMIIHPERELAKEIINLVSHPNAIDVNELYKGKLIIASTIIQEKSTIAHKSLIEIAGIHNLSNLRIVIVEKNNNETIIPKGDYIVNPGDKLFGVAKKEDIGSLFKLAGHMSQNNKDIMIYGSGKTAKMVAEELEKKENFNIKVIVNDEQKAIEFSELLSESLIVHGEATEIDLLKNEGISETDFFLALTANDELNMISSVLTKDLKVNSTITRIEKNDYLPISKTIGLNKRVNSSIATSNAIMKFVKHGNVLSTSTIKGVDVDEITFKVSESCKILNTSLKDIKFPKDCIVAFILREGQIIIPDGLEKIILKDEIVIFSKRKFVGKIEKMFGDI